ncbi:hypothetical protein [Dyadobacter sp. CY326]|uniref:hypothetical protein n=1 Tax=Dyadobacter sp. CY326 TaxID=2907300 RepID=UPI001F34E2F9|nr:hypothetical protein [Dyadobacter sp. CY326]MCE7068527.1 hypothetical protein [Dyadobacter sp. CY326]
MKNNIACHYQDGALVFCTTHSYTYNDANEILNLFNVLGLSSTLQVKSTEHFNVIGHLNVDYDPFHKESGKWSEVMTQLIANKSYLEKHLEKINFC